MKQLIIFLIRRRFGLKKYQNFRFDNQKSLDDFYWFDDITLWKFEHDSQSIRLAHVSLNWLLDDECKVIKGGFVR